MSDNVANRSWRTRNRSKSMSGYSMAPFSDANRTVVTKQSRPSHRNLRHGFGRRSASTAYQALGVGSQTDIPIRSSRQKHGSAMSRSTGSMMGFCGESSSSKERLASKRHSSRHESFTSYRNGTGAHDDTLVQSQGNFRQPSLRRRDGVSVETPQSIRNHIHARERSSTVSAQVVTPPLTCPAAAKEHTRTKSMGGRVASSSSLSENERHSMGDPDQSHDESSVATTSRVRLRRMSAPQPGDRTPITNGDRLRVLTECVKREKEYLELPDGAKASEQSFWEAVLGSLRQRLKTKLGDDWKELKQRVARWCESRREKQRVRRLTAPADGRQDLDAAIDAWNDVRARRYCIINRGFIHCGVWDAVESTVLSFVRAELQEWIHLALQSRISELDRLYQPPPLTESSTPDDYIQTIKRLEHRVQINRTSVWDQHQLKQTEALLGFVSEIRPDLEQVLEQQLQAQFAAGDKGNNEREESIMSDAEEGFWSNDMAVESTERTTPEASPETLRRLQEMELSLKHQKLSASQAIASPQESPKRKTRPEVPDSPVPQKKKRQQTSSRSVDAVTPASGRSTPSLPSIESLMPAARHEANEVSKRDAQRDKSVTERLCAPCSPTPSARTESPLFVRDSIPAPSTSCRKPSVTSGRDCLWRTPPSEPSAMRNHSNSSGCSGKHLTPIGGRYSNRKGYWTGSGHRSRRADTPRDSQDTRNNSGMPSVVPVSNRRHSSHWQPRRQVGNSHSPHGEPHTKSPGRFREKTSDFVAMPNKDQNFMIYSFCKKVRNDMATMAKT